jgi:hypothetical protein
MGPVFTPLANVPGTVGPYLFTLAVTEPALPLARVDRPTFEGVRGATLSPLIWIESLNCRDRLFRFFISEILAATNILGAKHRDILSSLISTESSLDLNNLLCMLFEVLI